MSQNYQVLARKYRPQTLNELKGQDVLVQTLTQSLKQDRLPHAILLHGIRGVGKTTTARIIAKSLNCETGVSPNPCGDCSPCQQIQKGSHLDVIEMDGASQTSVEDIRDVIDSAKYKAVNGNFKIFIIDEVHMLSKSAFNALLKTLEEPPEHVKFIFATTELKKIPDTILSRCQRFDLKRMTLEEIITHLKALCAQESVEIEEDALSYLAKAADGSMRDSLSLLDQAIALSKGEKVSTECVRDMLGVVRRGDLFSLLKALFQGQIETALKMIQELLNEGGDPLLILQDMLDTLYWIICLKSAPSLAHNPAWPKQEREEGNTFAQDISLPSLMQGWQLFSKSYEEVAASPLPSQCLEMVMIRFCYMGQLPSLDEVINNTAPPTFNAPTHNPAVPVSEEGQKKKPEVTPTPTVSQVSNTQKATALTSFKDVVKLVSESNEPLLFGHLIHDVHLVSFQIGDITVRLSDMVPADFTRRLTTLLQEKTGQNWKITLSEEGGHSTLGQQEKDQRRALEQASLNQEKIQEILRTFPEAKASIFKEEKE